DLKIDAEAFYDRALDVYRRLIPIAEAYDVRLITHPSDPPVPQAPFAPHRWSKIVELVPSTHSGYLYCVGTRYETGVDIHEDIRRANRNGKIFQVDFRNVRGSIPTAGGYEEVALEDGDMNMFSVLQTLLDSGYQGSFAVDHLPNYVDDTPFQGMASAYA